MQNGWGDFDTMIAIFEKGIGDGPWLLGDHFSVADVMCGGAACFLKQFGMLPDSKTLDNDATRCMEGPAYQRSMELSA